MRFIPDDLQGCYVDVGANQGQSIEAIRLFKARAPIHSFEANPLLAAKLQARYAGQPGVTVSAYGLSDEAHTMCLYVPVYKNFVYDGLASFDRESAAWLNSQTVFLFSPSKLRFEEIQTSTQRLDDQGLAPVFIKVDVQGYEYHVIKGGIETIRRYEPILMIEALDMFPQLSALLQELGYEQYVFDDHGFYRADMVTLNNTFLMTPQRARTVVLSPRHRESGAGSSRPFDPRGAAPHDVPDPSAGEAGAR